MKVVMHSLFMAVRDLRNLFRQPWYVAFTLIQPVIWLVLFGQLFQNLVKIPGFGSSNFIAFLTPGVVAMNALFSGGWSGMSTVNDLDRGVMDRFLVSPVSRAAIIIGRVIQMALVTVIQASIIIVIGFIMGASYRSTALGVLVLLVCAVLLAVPFAALSNALALLLRQEESVIGVNQFILLPLTFLSSVFIAPSVIPGWINNVSQFNPLNWAVTAARPVLLNANVDWGYVLTRIGWLAALTVVSIWLATLAFKSYQRSI